MLVAIRAIAVLLVLLSFAAPVTAWDRGQVTRFATLPAGAEHPEGITVDGKGNVYVTTFAVAGTSSGTGQMFVHDSTGKLLRQVNVEGSSTLLLDLAFHPQTKDLLVIDFGGKQVLSVNPVNGKSKLFTTIPGGAAAGPNVLTFDAAGNVYVSDSFQGAIWRTGPQGGTATAWVQSALLTTSGVPPFGANGLAFNNAGDSLFVCNTGNDSVVRIPVASGGAAGTPETFVNSVNGCDGLIIDESDNLWIAANQADEIVVVNPSGRAIAKLGDFGGIDGTGAPIGLLFPASLVRSGGFIYVTNLSLDLRLFGLAQTVDSQWAAQVTTHTVSKIPAVIPSVPGLP
ncbi:MAG TPA: SMP-30/gluconolactonase/LRE family protein [Methylomirabilota bacterium]|nr:SMP-30/gluconolactonase/LRE family protein [Methylomirabilota bacterium]